MSNNHLNDYPISVIKRLKDFIDEAPLYDLEVRDNVLFVKIDKRIEESEIIKLLDFLWDNELDIAFHDTIHPTISDPGAYFSYSAQKSPDKNLWSMTYGNHGWSGGIYFINRSTLARQICNLVNKTEMQFVQVTGVAFFSHFPVVGVAKSEIKDEEILKMHSR